MLKGILQSLRNQLRLCIGFIENVSFLSDIMLIIITVKFA